MYTSKGWNVFVLFGRICTDQASSTEDDDEAVVEEMKQHVPGQDLVSDWAENTLNTPVEDAKQTHPHHEEDISDDDDVITDQDYTPSCDENLGGVIEDHPELKEIIVCSGMRRSTCLLSIMFS